jgi:hypothetical protein
MEMRKRLMEKRVILQSTAAFSLGSRREGGMEVRIGGGPKASLADLYRTTHKSPRVVRWDRRFFITNSKAFNRPLSPQTFDIEGLNLKDMRKPLRDKAFPESSFVCFRNLIGSVIKPKVSTQSHFGELTGHRRSKGCGSNVWVCLCGVVQHSLIK